MNAVELSPDVAAMFPAMRSAADLGNVFDAEVSDERIHWVVRKVQVSDLVEQFLLTPEIFAVLNL